MQCITSNGCARDELLPLARQRAELELASYSAGRATLIDVITAQTMFADAALLALDREALVARDGARGDKGRR